MSESILVKELVVPLPWGHIAVKAWGIPSDTPVLVIHGVQDNAGSWDQLIPRLPRGYYFFCIDLPGHGRSSPFPEGLPLFYFNYIYTVKLIVEHLQWAKFTIMGHSLGAQISVFYSAFYPSKVSNAILIDGLTPLITPEDQLVSHFRGYFDNLYKLNVALSSKKPPSYSREEALKRLMDSRPTDIGVKPAKSLMERTLVPSGDGFRFSTDQRLKYRLQPGLTMGQMNNLVKLMRCPALMIIAKDTYDLVDTVSESRYHERLTKFFLGMPNFKFVIVEGNHDVHMNFPERVAPFIEKFLIKTIKGSL